MTKQKKKKGKGGLGENPSGIIYFFEPSPSTTSDHTAGGKNRWGRELDQMKGDMYKMRVQDIGGAKTT
jgi:hypothetical protein